MSKLNIYLADLVHNTIVRGSFMMPLNIGYLAAYAQKRFGQEVNIKLFKFPQNLIKAIQDEPPDILGLGNYTWNKDLNYKMAQFVKSRSKDTITVFGGPELPLDYDARENFLKKRPLLDFYIINQGESGFSYLIERVLSDGLTNVKNRPLNGGIFLKDDKLVYDPEPHKLIPIEEIPSPYTTGVLDKFFDMKLIPLAETDRWCPYTCAYCAWGQAMDHKVEQFSLEQVFSDFDYITQKVIETNYTGILYMGNANFGLFERDKEIAKYVKDLNIKYGFPRKFETSWAKNVPDRIIEMAEVLGDMSEVSMSFQSLNPVVLKNIRRANIKLSSYQKIQQYFLKKGIHSFSELILGLPGETKKSHLDALKTLINMNAGSVVSYNCMTLGGTSLDTKAEREKYDIKTKYRLFDIGFGDYNGIVSIEAEEIVRSTNTMSEEDIFFFRPVHWIMQFLWEYKYYIQLLKYLQLHGIHPIDFILRLLSDKDNIPEDVERIYNDFDNESKNEWFNTPEDLFNFYSKPENFKKIMSGTFGKLNFKYMFRVLNEIRPAFDKHVSHIAKKMMAENDKKGQQENNNIIDNIIRYMSTLYINFDDTLNFEESKTAAFDYDIVNWEKDGYEKDITEYQSAPPITYDFYVTDDQKNALVHSLEQYRSKDKNTTLRKMSEFIKKEDLFYKVR